MLCKSFLGKLLEFQSSNTKVRMLEKYKNLDKSTILKCLKTILAVVIASEVV